MIKKTGTILRHLISGVWPLGCTMLLAATPTLAQEQFFFNDDSGIPPATASTPDGRLKFEVYGALAVTEGDIILGNAFNLIHGKETPKFQKRGIARDTKLDKWIDGIVYYVIHPNLAEPEIEKTEQAIGHWETSSSLTFVDRTADVDAAAAAGTTPDFDYINIQDGSGCGSFVGRVSRPNGQELFVHEKCSTGSVIHELGHAIGLFHEHTRADRDSFVTVVLDNVQSDKLFNFDIMNNGISDVLNYDYVSIMHYGTTFFSKNGNATILVPDGVTIGQRSGLSPIDLASVDQMYATDLSLITSSTADTENNTVTVQVIATSIGAMGANTLRYALPLTDGDTVASFEGAGWSCVSSAENVDCSSERLANGSSTVLSIKLNSTAADGTIGPGYLSSKSFDADLSNNGEKPAEPANPDVVPDTTPVPDMTPTEITNPTSPTTPGPTKSVPTQAAAAPAASDGGGGGGSMGWLLLGWLFVRVLSQPVIRTRT